jgi:hypothetical protein
MVWSNRIRQFHRWVSLIFTSTVAANFVAMGLSPTGVAPMWITLSPLPFLFMLLFSGLYLFALPYLSKWQAGRTQG